MYRLGLVNVPFAAVQFPSIALTQLAQVARTALPGRVEVDVHYLNQDMARHIGLSRYRAISDGMASTNSGLGDWLFRRLGFPAVPDNREDYSGRYLWSFGEQKALAMELCGQVRDTLSDWMDEVIRRRRLDSYDAIGLTSTFQQNMACFAFARRIKARNAKVVTMMGGANCESPMGQVIARNVPEVDFVFSGPSLRTFPMLLQNLAEGEFAACHGIPGVFTKERLSRDATLAAKPEIGAELDINNSRISLEYDDFLGSLETNFPDGEVEPDLLFETSRGCWWGERAHCTFCGLNGITMSYRAMKPELALRQIDGLLERYGDRASTFSAVDNIMPLEYLTELFPRLRRRPGKRIFYEVKANLTDEQMAVIARAGVTDVQPGIESLASSTLKLMKKGSTALQNVAFLKRCRAHGVTPGWNLLVGFPGEQEAVFEKYTRDLPLLTHLPPPAGAFPVRFDRYSPYFTQADSYGLKLEPYDFYSVVYPLPDNEIRNLAYYFIDANEDAPYAQAYAEWLPAIRKQIGEWRQRWVGPDEATPRLEYAGGSEQTGTAPSLVIDSRAGKTVSHELDPRTALVLACTDGPIHLSRLARELPDLAPPELSRCLDHLRRLSLVMEEGENVIGLVVKPGGGRLAPALDGNAQHR